MKKVKIKRDSSGFICVKLEDNYYTNFNFNNNRIRHLETDFIKFEGKKLIRARRERVIDAGLINRFVM